MAVMATDGGGGGYVAQPSREPQTHVVTATDTVANLADRYGVTPQALRDANPDIFMDPSARRRDEAMNGGDLMLTGETIHIPPASQSITDDPLSSDFNPTYPSPNSEYTVGGEGQNAGGGVTWNPGDGSIKITGTQIIAPPGADPNATVQYEVRRDAELTIGKKDASDDQGTKTEYSVEGVRLDKVVVSAEGGSKRNPVEGEASTGAGTRFRYKVVLEGKDHSAAQIAAIDPFDPTTIPEGATVTVDGQAFMQSELAGSFRHIGFETNVKDAAGVSYSITREGNSVQVTMGPNQAVEAYNGFGVRSDVATAMLGRQDNLGASTVRTAQFDLSNPDGQAAYAHFVATGQVAHETAGVSNVATIERIDYSSQTRAKLGLGPEALNVQADLAGPQNTGAFVRTTYPDGSYTYTTNLQYSGNVPLQVTQRFDASGVEVLSERTYGFKIDGDRPSPGWLDSFLGADEGAEEATIAHNLNIALTGNPDGVGPAHAGETTTITFTESQLQALMTQTRNAGEATHPSNPLNLLVGGNNGQPVATSMDFAVAMARNLGGDPYGFADRLRQVSQTADGDVRNGFDRIDATAK